MVDLTVPTVLIQLPGVFSFSDKPKSVGRKATWQTCLLLNINQVLYDALNGFLHFREV